MSVYTPGIPTAAQLISASQQPIADNFTQLNAQFTVEHSAFWTGSANGDGLHKQTTMPKQIFAAISPGVNYGSYFTSQAGTLAGTITEAVYKSGDAAPVSILSAVKAWGTFTGATLTRNDCFNVDTITAVGGNPGQYNVKMTNALASATYAVIISTNAGVTGPNMTAGSISGYQITDSQNFKIYCKSLTATATINAIVSFIVLQS